MIALYSTPQNHVNFLLYNDLSMQLLSADNTPLWILIKLILVYYKWFCGCVIPVLLRFQLQEKSLVQLS